MGSSRKTAISRTKQNNQVYESNAAANAGSGRDEVSRNKLRRKYVTILMYVLLLAKYPHSCYWGVGPRQ